MNDLETRLKEPKELIYMQNTIPKDSGIYFDEHAKEQMHAVSILMLAVNLVFIFVFALIIGNGIFLAVTGIEITEPDMKTVEMDVNDFFEYAKPKEVSKSEILSFITSYASVEVLYQETGIKLPQYEGDIKNVYDDLKYYDIELELDNEKKCGILTFRASLDENALEKHSYSFNVQFKIKDYTPDSSSLTIKHKKASEVFVYKNGRKVYLVKNWGRKSQVVYLEADGILFTFEIENEEEKIENARKLINLMLEGVTVDARTE